MLLIDTLLLSYLIFGSGTRLLTCQMTKTRYLRSLSALHSSHANRSYLQDICLAVSWCCGGESMWGRVIYLMLKEKWVALHLEIVSIVMVGKTQWNVVILSPTSVVDRTNIRSSFHVSNSWERITTKCKNYIVEIEFDNLFRRHIYELKTKFTNLVAVECMGTTPERFWLVRLF